MFKKKKMENKAEDLIDDTNIKNNLREIEIEDGNEILEENENTDDTSVNETPDLQTQLNAANDKYLRLFAEFDNYKRRTSKERMDLFKSAGKDIITAMLPVLDDFERALKALPDNDETSGMKEGVILVQNKLNSILQQQGLKEMISLNENFNVDLHEAITGIPAPSDDLKGKILDELEKGYYLNNKVIRFAKVVVGA